MNVLLHVECYLIHPLSYFAFRKTLNSFSASKTGPTKVTLAFWFLIWLGPLWPARFLSCPCRTWRLSDEPRAASTDIDRGRCKFPRLWFVGIRMKLIMYRPEVGSETWTTPLTALDKLSMSPNFPQLPGPLPNYLGLWPHWPTFYKTVLDQAEMFPTKSHEVVCVFT